MVAGAGDSEGGGGACAAGSPDRRRGRGPCAHLEVAAGQQPWAARHLLHPRTQRQAVKLVPRAASHYVRGVDLAAENRGAIRIKPSLYPVKKQKHHKSQEEEEEGEEEEAEEEEARADTWKPHVSWFQPFLTLDVFCNAQEMVLLVERNW